jgi:hypothetical protein
MSPNAWTESRRRSFVPGAVSTGDNQPVTSDPRQRHLDLTRRELLASAGAGAAGLLLQGTPADAQTPSGRPVVFAHVTLVNLDVVQEDHALVVQGSTIAAMGPRDAARRCCPA